MEIALSYEENEEIHLRHRDSRPLCRCAWREAQEQKFFLIFMA